ncbi:hypothetical protein OE88DRAFT_1785755 [Heliocybe sulcata]|uniref:RRM domain-containing protein n=1 Tax=Heliocybe sulcata TaxID=5364 RepID=A0A5C3NAN0_9AGAM|nr:hypothetical protein OE88DRAFT_1785755 [Heliocybe sulcata]
MDTTRSTPSEWVNRFVDIDCNSSIQEIRELFSQCGEIYGIYPWKSDKSPQQHYFVEFSQSASVANARALGKLHHHLSVHALSMVPQLVDRCRSVAPRSSTQESPEVSFASPRPSSPMSSRESSVGPPRKRTRRSGVKHKIRAAPGLAPAAGLSRMDSSPPPFSSNAHKVETSFRIEPRRPENDKENDAHRTRRRPSLPAHPLISPSIPIRLSHASFSSSGAHITVFFNGERVRLDVATLSSDPHPVVTLLKTAQCGRETWMMVGGHYRMQGNPAAALAVTTAMVDVLTSSGVPEYELKPAYLMLSGCHRDLAKQARAGSDEAAEQFSQSVRWLQRVYGRDAPPLDPPSICPPLPAKPSPPSNTGHIRILEREIACLRARLEGARKMEGVVERKDRELEEMRAQVEVARRMEGVAMERVRREVEARERAEERAEEGGVVREVVEVLRRAARGEGVV